MLKQLLTIAMLVSLFAATNATGQNPCGNTKLICLIPTVLHTTSSAFNFFNEAFGTQIAQLPLATPASGFIFELDKATGVYHVASESYGPLLTERAETIGRHKYYAAFTYQRFDFSEIDGNNLKHIPIVFFFPSLNNASVVTNSMTRLDATVDQFAAFGTFGLTSRIDISLAIPWEKISMGVSSAGTEFSTTTAAMASFTTSLPGFASGVGDVVVSAKGTVLKHEKLGLAVGGEVRFPTGDERNFLGSGAWGLKPYFVVSRAGKVSPHLNVAYQWNGDTLLAKNINGQEDNLPGFFGYAVGVDAGLKRVTVIADLLGQHFFDAAQVSTPRNIPVTIDQNPTTLSSVTPINGSYDVTSLSLGVKVNPVAQLLLSGNLLIKLNSGGLRATVVPLAGISYSF